jgi:hypothetical protein
VSGSPMTDAAHRAFVQELADHEALAGLLRELRSGHGPDDQGWCRHSYHAYHWERHPCPVLEFADLVDRYNAGRRR